MRMHTETIKNQRGEGRSLKFWAKFEIKGFGVKMDENVAVSENGGYVIRQFHCQDVQEDE